MATSPRSWLILALVGLFLLAPLAAVGVLVPGAVPAPAESPQPGTESAARPLHEDALFDARVQAGGENGHDDGPPSASLNSLKRLTMEVPGNSNVTIVLSSYAEDRWVGSVGGEPLAQEFRLDALADVDASASPVTQPVGDPAPADENSPPVTPPKEPSQSMLVLLAASQNSLALFGLAQHPGLAHGPADPYASLSLRLSAAADAVVPAESVLASPAHGWILQAMWTVTLAAVGWALARAVGAPAFAAFLFSRFSRDDVLGNDRRSQLYEAVRANPGIPFGALCEQLGLAHGVVQHHLRLLEQHELVRRLRDGRTTRFYPKGPKFDPPAALAAPRREILDALAREPGLTTPQLATRLGQRVQSTWEHVQRLRGAGLVSPQRRGKAFAWTLTA